MSKDVFQDIQARLTAIAEREAALSERLDAASLDALAGGQPAKLAVVEAEVEGLRRDRERLQGALRAAERALAQQEAEGARERLPGLIKGHQAAAERRTAAARRVREAAGELIASLWGWRLAEAAERDAADALRLALTQANGGAPVEVTETRLRGPDGGAFERGEAPFDYGRGRKAADYAQLLHHVLHDPLRLLGEWGTSALGWMQQPYEAAKKKVRTPQRQN